jgi:hypothetical protein
MQSRAARRAGGSIPPTPSSPVVSRAQGVGFGSLPAKPPLHSANADTWHPRAARPAARYFPISYTRCPNSGRISLVIASLTALVEPGMATISLPR